jgi:hypothetical protein
VASRGVPSGEDEGVRRMSGARNPFVPVVTTRCADCGVGTHSIDEWYMVKDDVWEQAWAGRRKSWHSLPGQQILCIGCLEERIGRTLTCHDFTDAPVNDPHESNISARLRDRLTTNENALLRTAMR